MNNKRTFTRKMSVIFTCSKPWPPWYCGDGGGADVQTGEKLHGNYRNSFSTTRRAFSGRVMGGNGRPSNTTAAVRPRTGPSPYLYGNHKKKNLFCPLSSSRFFFYTHKNNNNNNNNCNVGRILPGNWPRVSIVCVWCKMQKPQIAIKKISVDGKRKNRKK